MEKKLDGNYTGMLRAILKKSLRLHPTKQQLYSHSPPISKTIQVRRTRHEGHCRRSRDELISDILLWTLSYGQAKAGRPDGTYVQQLSAYTGCSLEDLPGSMDDREGGWRGPGRSVLVAWHDHGNIYIYIYIYIYICVCVCVCVCGRYMVKWWKKALIYKSNEFYFFNLIEKFV